MTILEIYNLAIAMGIAADPRGADGVKRAIARLKKDYTEMPSREKETFDKESLTNPYADTRILFGDPKKRVQKILAGIDMDVAEILLADRLNEKGKNIDLVVAHHPSGAALAGLDQVMDIQVDLAARHGVPVNIAEDLLKPRAQQVKRRLNPINHSRSIDAARLMQIPLMSIHTVWDNLGWNFMQNYLDKKSRDLETVGDVLDVVNELGEFKESTRGKAGPMITAGDRKSRAGKAVVFGFTGGTEGAKQIYEKLANAGVGTVIDMHMAEEHFEEAKKHHINIIISGHMASDSIGANLFFDALEKKGIEVIPCSGFIRIRR